MAGYLILGGSGQLGSELKKIYPEAHSPTSEELDITDQASLDNYNWQDIKCIFNAAAFTNVDGAETEEGRVQSWMINAQAVSNLAKIATRFNICLVHISTDYVYDGTQKLHTEAEPFSPLSIYGASKAAGDLAVSVTQKHYIIRTSWVIGTGRNFIRTMLGVGQKGINPNVVSDQIGRLTFTSELGRAIKYIDDNGLPYGTYNVTNSGDPVSWAEITRAIFKYANLPNSVIDVTTAEYFSDKPMSANRPLHSTLSLEKISALGFESRDWQLDLESYIKKECTI